MLFSKRLMSTKTYKVGVNWLNDNDENGDGDDNLLGDFDQPRHKRAECVSVSPRA